MMNRKLLELGLSLMVAYSILLISFFGIAFFLFRQTEFAQYIMVGAGTMLLLRISKEKRTVFLKTVYNRHQFLKLRLVENLIAITLFVIVLIIHQYFLWTLVLIMMALIVIILSFKKKSNAVLPTPFGKHPFEFIIGFRRGFLFILIPYFLIIMAILYSNYNLAFFALFVMTLICFSFYTEPEDPYFVWNFSLSPQKFLKQKLKTAMLYLTFLILPIFIAMLCFFSSKVAISISAFAICYVYLTLIVFVKYTAYPSEISLPQGIMLAISIMLPPLLLFLIPIMFKKAKDQLKSILV